MAKQRAAKLTKVLATKERKREATKEKARGEDKNPLDFLINSGIN